MFKAIRSGTVPFASHLEQCDHCRILFKLLSHHNLPYSAELEKPDQAAIRQWGQIPRLAQSRRPVRAIRGRVVLDSWAHLPAMQIRQAPPDVERHVSFAAGQYTLELVADRSTEGWEFVARVYDRDKVTSEFFLQVGRTKLSPESHDCYFWTASKPPRSLKLLSPSLKIDFGKLSW
jgi:hypothetical protein